MNKTEKALTILLKKKREKIQINKIINEREGKTEMQRIIRDFCK